MKFRVERDHFADAASWTGRNVPAHPATPILSGLRLQADGDAEPRVSVAMFDHDLSARAELVADVVDPGVAVVNGRLLVDIAKSLPNQPVEVIAEGSRLALRCGRTRFELPTLPAHEYPQLPQMPPASGSVPGVALAGAVSQVAIAAARGDAMANLTGILVEVADAVVTMAATDRYRLAVRRLQWTPLLAELRTSAIVPAKSLAESAKSLAAADEVRLALSDSDGEPLVGIEGMHRHTTTRQISGEFPDYRKLLPTQHSTVARVDTQQLIEAVKRVSLVAERTSAVRLEFAGDEVTLEAGTGDEVARDAIECATTGDQMERIAFNPAFLVEGLNALGRPVTHLGFTTSSKPVVLTGAADQTAEASDDYRYLLMPVRLPA